jgi:hypothetical protein
MTRLVLSGEETTASDAIELGAACNAGSVDVAVFVFNSLTSVEIVLQAGSDRENWRQFSSTLFTGAGFGRFRFRGVATRYIRLFFRGTGSTGGIGLLATTVHGSHT